MKSVKDIKQSVRELKVESGEQIHRRVLDKLLRAMDKSKKQTAISEPIIWRIIMKRPLTKIAAAAAVILIAVSGITLLERSAAPAWAIEDTIGLLKNFNAMHFTGTALDEQGKTLSVEGWARANENQTASNHLRIVTETGRIDVVSGNQRYQYNPATATVEITEGYGPAMNPWPGADFFELLKKIVLDWDETYGKDPATNRDRVFVTCSHPAGPGPRSWWFEFDVESKLPVSIKQWENMAREGTPGFYVKSITYLDDLPNEMFQFEIPEGAKIVPALAERNGKLQDPNCGMLLGNMTAEQACVEITRRYWQAVIEQDWQTVAKLCPTSTAEQWENKYSGSNLEEIVGIEKPYGADGCTIVPCTIRFDSDVTRTINTTVIFREIAGQRSCVIANTWRQDWD